MYQITPFFFGKYLAFIFTFFPKLIILFQVYNVITVKYEESAKCDWGAKEVSCFKVVNETPETLPLWEQQVSRMF